MVTEHRAHAPYACRTRPKVLLATAGAGGTIAAVRELNRSGFDVGVICSERLGAAAWSNQASRSYPAPPENDADRFLDFLMQTGASEPGQILLPTSDQTAWLYTANASLLKQHFHLYQPSIPSMRTVLDKKLLAEAAIRAGISVLPSWEPRNMEELRSLARILPYPILIKPRAHVHRVRNNKGLVAYSETELVELYRQFVESESFHSAQSPLLPDANLPLLQQFVELSGEGVHSVSGFLDRSGERVVTRLSVKIFQRSEPVGVGICFEARPAIPALSAAVLRLCQELDYFGMFEVEFIRYENSWAVIDFNPRLFNQVGLDIYRGMPLPVFACLEAIDDVAGLRKAIAMAQTADENADAVFSDRFTMASILIAKALTGRISPSELLAWRHWRKANADRAVDFAFNRQDRLPGLVHAASEIYLGLRAFPRFLRLTPRSAPEIEPVLEVAHS
jgi:D-aspartate ligase